MKNMFENNWSWGKGRIKSATWSSHDRVKESSLLECGTVPLG